MYVLVSTSCTFIPLNLTKVYIITVSLFTLSCKMRMTYAELELQRANYFNAHTFAKHHKQARYLVFTSWLQAELLLQPQSPFYKPDSAYPYAVRAWQLAQGSINWKRFPEGLMHRIECQRKSVLDFRKQKTLEKPSKAAFESWQPADLFIYDSLRYVMQAAYEQWMLDSVYNTQDIERLEHFKALYHASIWIPAINDTLDVWHSKALLYKSKNTAPLLQYAQRHPKGRYFNLILDSAFSKIVRDRDTLHAEWFIQVCNSEFRAQKAWQELYKQYWFFYQNKAPQQFIKRYPNAPHIDAILQDLNAEQSIIYPLKQEDSTGLMNIKFGYVDSTGQWRINPQYEYADVFYNHRAIVSNGDSLMYITPSALSINNVQFEEAYPFTNAVTFARKHNRWYKVYLSGHYESINADEVFKPDRFGTIFIKDGKYGLLNKNAQITISPVFDKISSYSNGYASATFKLQSGLLDTMGKFRPFSAQWIGPVQSNGQFIFKTDSVFGIADTSLRILCSGLQYIVPLDEKTYLVVSQNRFGYFDYSGCYVKFPEPAYDAVLPVTQYGNRFFLRWEQDRWPVFINSEAMLTVPVSLQAAIKGQYEPLQIIVPYWIMFKKPSGFEIWNLKSQTAYNSDRVPEMLLNTCFQLWNEGFYQILGTSATVMKSVYPFKALSSNCFLGRYNDGFSLFNAEGKCLASQLKKVELLTNSTLLLVYNNMKVVLLNTP